jgi:hypothetical protein
MSTKTLRLLQMQAALLLLWLAGCASPIPIPIPGASHDLIAFLQSGLTTREEVLFKLGQPSGSFEQEHIITYRIGEDVSQGLFIITPTHEHWRRVRYSLVLLFDSQGVLQKQNLVEVN